MSRFSTWKIVLLFCFLIGLLIYGNIDPVSSEWFPKCPFLMLTGLECPGCGSQRAIHQLLNGNLNAAFTYNPFAIIALPYMLLGVLFEIKSINNRFPKIERLLFGYKTIYIILAAIILFWIFRNI